MRASDQDSKPHVPLRGQQVLLYVRLDVRTTTRQCWLTSRLWQTEGSSTYIYGVLTTERSATEILVAFLEATRV